jgi:hypothetical protein
MGSGRRKGQRRVAEDAGIPRDARNRRAGGYGFGRLGVPVN